MKIQLLSLLVLLTAGCTQWRPGAPQSQADTSAERQEVKQNGTPEPPLSLTTPTPMLPTPETLKTGKTVALTAPSRVKVRRQSLKDSRSNLPLQLPGKPEPQEINDSELDQLLAAAEGFPTASGWRQVAERALVVEDYPLAARAFYAESEIYRGKGQVQAALAEELKAAQYETQLTLFQSTEGADDTGLERLEPARGCYVGAFIDRDDTLEKHQFRSQIHGDVPQFNKLVGKPHASFFMYRAYGKPFPRKWAEFLKKNGAIPHIAWEPRDISKVVDDEYLRGFLAQAAELDHPVMLRFAGEMNGEWTPYHGDPEEYKRAFRLVHKLSRSAPKVALMWCPNTVPRAGMDDYYPGDDYVDWVGVNFYSVPFLDNNPDRPGDLIHPTDHLKAVYEKYSDRKPIAVGEWAASQQSVLTERRLQEFAAAKLSQLYATLPTRYPRVKMVNWYDCNNIKHANAARKLNNFQVTDSPQLLKAYSRAVGHPHYLGAEESKSEISYEQVQNKVVLPQDGEVRVDLKSYDPVLRVYFLTAGKVIHASDDPVEWYLTASQLQEHSPGLLKIVVFDSKNRLVVKEKVDFKVSMPSESAL